MGESRVLLIGGPPGAGKTTLGRAIAARMGYASLTVDDLTIAARAITTATSHPALHAMAGVDHRQYFTDGPPERLIADSVALQDTFWPAVERVVTAHASFKESIVIDWWLLAPRYVAALEYDNVVSVWLHIEPSTLERRERANTDFLEGSRAPERMFENIMARSLWRNGHVVSEARELGLPVLHQPGAIPVAELVQSATNLIGWDPPGQINSTAETEWRSALRPFPSRRLRGMLTGGRWRHVSSC